MSEQPNPAANRSSDPIAGLKPTQLTALQALLAGKSVTDAAQAAGVDRSRVSYWKNHDPEFTAAFNTAKRDQYERGCRRLQGLLDGAIDNIERAILEEGDVSASFRLLKRFEKISSDPKPEDSTNSDVIRLLHAIKDWQWDQIRQLLEPAEEEAIERALEVDAAYEKIEARLTEAPNPDPETEHLQEVRRKLRKIGRDNPKLVELLKELAEDPDVDGWSALRGKKE